jgi:ketosteroid isomerase-like protein
MANDPNTALIQSAYAHFQKGDIASLIDQLTDDVAWTTPYPREIVPHGGTWTGKDGVRTFFEQLARSYEFTKFDPHDFISSGDYVVALVSIAGHARETGVHAAEEAAHVFRVRNGKISEFREYTDARAVVAAYAPQTAAASA